MDNDIKTIKTNSFTYEEYIEEVSSMAQKGTTSGDNQSPSLIEYTKLNFSRMKRLNKTSRLNEDLLNAASSVAANMDWIIITEAWCGDAAQNIPLIALLASQIKNVTLSLVYRDENPEMMDSYLTNGSRSIPKLIIFEEGSGKPLAVWGPRPKEVQDMVMTYKYLQDPKPSYDEFSIEIHKWYAKNKNQMLQSELLAIFQKINDPIQ